MFARSTTPSLIVIGTSHIATLALAVEAPATAKRGEREGGDGEHPAQPPRRTRRAPVEVLACGCRRPARATRRSIDAPDETDGC